TTAIIAPRICFIIVHKIPFSPDYTSFSVFIDPDIPAQALSAHLVGEPSKSSIFYSLNEVPLHI
ncbi:MAG: hypothetical protein ACRDHW_01055, partial [Ktedonobacteraceae bacterium]